MSEHKHHIISLKTYMVVFFTLLAMTAFTVFSAQFDLGWFTIILALLIASFKSSLVLLFFMHLYYDNKINLHDVSLNDPSEFSDKIMSEIDSYYKMIDTKE